MSHNPKNPPMSVYPRISAVIARISMPWNWKLMVDPGTFPTDSCTLRVHVDGDRCTKTGQPYTWDSRRWLLEPGMSDSEIVRTAWLATKSAAEHELAEMFKYRGVPIYDPHLNLDALAVHIQYEYILSDLEKLPEDTPFTVIADSEKPA